MFGSTETPAALAEPAEAASASATLAAEDEREEAPGHLVEDEWDVHCTYSLAALIATPHAATHGMWSAAQFVGVKRALYLRTFRFAQRQLGEAGLSAHLQAMSEVANWRNVMRTVLRFAVPFCTPTGDERWEICMTCHGSDSAARMARWLSCGVDPNTVDVDGDTLPLNKGAPLLFIAARKGHVSLINFLLRSGAGVDETNANGLTPLYIAAQEGHLAAVMELIAAGANVNKASTDDGTAPLFVAAQEGHLTVVTKLIAAGGFVNMARTNDGTTPLYIASEHGHLTVVTKLVAAGAVINKAKTNDGSTPLFIAAQNGRLAVVMKLISAGADVNKAATNDGATPLFAAVLQGHLTVVTKLIAAGADVDKATTDWGCTPLIIATQNGQLTVVTKLIAAGADVNKAATDDGSTPLFFAASFGWTAVVSELLQHGADKSITGSNHETPLWSAEVGGYPAIVALLS